VLWYQGESDANCASKAGQYATRLRQLIAAVRCELGEALPFIIVLVSISCTDRFPFVQQIRKAQQAVAQDTEHVVCVDTDGLPLQSDGLHLTLEAQIALGQRIAAAWLQYECEHNATTALATDLELTYRRR
jgi:hypothetical protein